MRVRFEYSAILLFIAILFGKEHTALMAMTACATIHESGHLISAKALKIKIREMVIDIGGAKIYPYSSTYPYANELLLTFSGPLANLITVFILKTFSYKPLYFENILHGASDSSLSFLEYAYVFSLIQALLNLIPIISLDGGRILQSTLCILFSQKVGEISVKITTLIFAIILWILSVYFLLGSGGGISLFVFSICMFLKIFEN